MVRWPDRVSVDSGPSFASENGRRLRIFCKPPFTASTALLKADLMPFAKVDTIRLPDSKNHVTAPETAFLILFRPLEKAVRASVNFCEMPWTMLLMAVENFSRISESLPPVRLSMKV